MNLVQRAKDLAHRAHEGQVDKAGRPYIEHVARVAAAVADDKDAEAVAWLHDVLEDCLEFRDELWGFPEYIRRLVICLTRLPFQTSEEYYAGIREYRTAIKVKLADIADNADEARLALLDEKTATRLRKKYANALAALGHIMNVKRYDIQHGRDGYMEEDEYGDYVRYEDYVELLKSVERLAKDAERYRWLRDSLLVGDDLQALTDMPAPDTADEFDAAIDAAMQCDKD